MCSVRETPQAEAKLGLILQRVPRDERPVIRAAQFSILDELRECRRYVYTIVSSEHSDAYELNFPPLKAHFICDDSRDEPRLTIVDYDYLS